MTVLPKAFNELITELSKLPGVGPRTAERYALAIYNKSLVNSSSLSDSIRNIHNEVGVCTITFALVDKNLSISPLYSDENRDKTTVIVVAEPFDIVSIEKTGSYNGTYHVLGGLISPIDGVEPDQLTVSQLTDRVKNDAVSEVILGLNASVEGETTALYIQQSLGNTTKVTRLARGLPVGVDLEYADQITISRALEGRTTL
ncbi:recombination protein RecR [Candidatus Saccharibacteria bacterium]|nr:recombination protein RecR [Candidatus Saccharibacteria bacterium]